MYTLLRKFNHGIKYDSNEDDGLLTENDIKVKLAELIS